jgi:hypothetical protein
VSSVHSWAVQKPSRPGRRRRRQLRRTEHI